MKCSTGTVNTLDIYINSDISISIQMIRHLSQNKLLSCLIAAFILALIITPGLAEQNQNIISIDNIILDPGDNATIPIMLFNTTGVASVGVKLTYYPDIVSVSNVTQGDITHFFGYDSSNASDGWITINAFMIGTQLTGDVILANVTLEATGSSGNSPLGLDILALCDKNTNNILVLIENGTFRIYNNDSESAFSGINGGISSGNGGASQEAFENIELTETDKEYISKDEKVSFMFMKPENVITFLNFTSLTNAGQITALIEVLRSTSTLADSPPSGIVYKHVNVWVGKYGYATDQHINNCIVGFRVSKEWINKNQIDETSIRLTRYSMSVWNDLLTHKVDEDNEYIYYETKTSGFSTPFAITGSSKVAVTPVTSGEKTEDTVESAPLSSTPQDAASKKKTAPLPGFGILICISCLFILSYKRTI